MPGHDSTWLHMTNFPISIDREGLMAYADVHHGDTKPPSQQCDMLLPCNLHAGPLSDANVIAHVDF